MSDPSYGDSDIFLISNDAVVLELDNNRDQTGNFFIKAGDDSVIFQVTEGGTVYVKGSSVHGSDRNRKECIIDLDYSDVLKSISALPIYEWQYKGNRQETHWSDGTRFSQGFWFR